MSFDRHFYEDHCYMDDSTNYVGMNVEIVSDTLEAFASDPTWNYDTAVKAGKGFTGHSLSKHSDLDHRPMTKCVSLDNDLYAHTECGAEHSAMFLLEDEKLVKLGDKFESQEAFVQYLNENAKRWNYYYSCSDSRKPNTENESYVYNCVYLKNKEKYKKKGLRKRNNTMKTDCPCKIKLRHLPNEKELTVVYVCNHHDHELSPEQFCKLQHGRRLPPYVKGEIFDFLALQVDKTKIRNYVEMETGFRMSRTFFYTLEKNMQKADKLRREMTEERLKMLNEKIVAMDELYNQNKQEQNDHNAKKSSSTSENNITRTAKNKKHKKKIEYAENNKQSKTIEEVTSRSSTFCETFQSVKNLQNLVKCEIQKNPWVPDQCVPVLPNTADDHIQEPHSVTQEQESESFTLNIEYYEASNNIQVNNDYNNDTVVDSPNENDHIAYETVVIEDDTEVIDNQTQEYVTIDSEMVHDEIAIETCDMQENIVGHLQLHGNQDAIKEGYMTEDTENLIEYTHNSSAETQHDIGIQTNMNIDTGQTLLPVFDVCMKDGNVMGFVVNNSTIKALKDGVDEAIQTSEDIIYSDTQDIENEDSEILETSNEQTRHTFTKHEYIHRYNIEQYMTQPQFPKYVEILAKETHMDVLNMFTNIYNEKAMFKLTTTQKGNEGNTRIRYITYNGKIKKKKTDASKREKFGKNLQSIFILKEKMRLLKKQNDELIKRNEYLQEVALKLVNLA